MDANSNALPNILTIKQGLQGQLTANMTNKSWWVDDESAYAYKTFGQSWNFLSATISDLPTMQFFSFILLWDEIL